jgi:hypothetical protein
VDWPTASFFSELADTYPCAKFVLTHRDPENWADSFGQTIYTILQGKDQAPPERKAFLDMVHGLVAKSGFSPGLDRDALIQRFIAHNEAVKAAIPASRLLVYQVKEGWEPLCKFLNAPIPDEAFPRTNDRMEFWERVRARQ